MLSREKSHRATPTSVLGLARTAALPWLLALASLSTSRFARAEESANRPAERIAPPLAPPVQPALPSRGPLFHPDGPGPFKLRIGVGALVDVLPTRVVQSEQRQIPQLTGEVRLGLPSGFSLDARLSAIVISNELQIGPSWTYHFGDLSLAIQDHQGFWYGYLGTSGFDATGWGYINRPGLAVGVPWRSERFSLTGELIFTFAQYARLGDSQVVSRVQTKLAGTALTFVVESMLEKGGIAYFGVGLLRTTVDYQAWIAFSDQRATLPYPRFLAGYVF